MKIIKVCGITQEWEADLLNEAKVDYAGFVQFVDWSKRVISTEKAVQIMRRLTPSISTVAVTVEPTKEQLDVICQAGFSCVQIHGRISDELLDSIGIPVIKAFNIKDMGEIERYCERKNICGYIFDAHTPGSGQAFDWQLVHQLPKLTKMTLIAGGIRPDNAIEALNATGFDGVDVSSGVEREDKTGKDRDKILALVRKVSQQSNA